jgi:hypothetical protein
VRERKKEEEEQRRGNREKGPEEKKRKYNGELQERKGETVMNENVVLLNPTDNNFDSNASPAANTDPPVSANVNDSILNTNVDDGAAPAPSS